MIEHKFERDLNNVLLNSNNCKMIAFFKRVVIICIESKLN
jgi:hypothetical protein